MSLRSPPDDKERRAHDEATMLRALKWARLPGHGHTIAEACKKFGISPNAYRKKRQELGPAAGRLVGDELALAALHPSGACTIKSIVSYYDWIDHSHPTDAEMTTILERLIAQGLVRRVGEDRFELACEWP